MYSRYLGGGGDHLQFRFLIMPNSHAYLLMTEDVLITNNGTIPPKPATFQNTQPEVLISYQPAVARRSNLYTSAALRPLRSRGSLARQSGDREVATRYTGKKPNILFLFFVLTVDHILSINNY